MREWYTDNIAVAQCSRITCESRLRCRFCPESLLSLNFLWLDECGQAICAPKVICVCSDFVLFALLSVRKLSQSMKSQTKTPLTFSRAWRRLQVFGPISDVALCKSVVIGQPRSQVPLIPVQRGWWLARETTCAMVSGIVNWTGIL